MKRFFQNIRKYCKYAIYSAKAELKSEVANSYLGWLWWILDPVCFMLIYTFIVEIVFNASEPYMPIFVFLGLTVWNFFNKVVSGSVKLVPSNKGIVTKVYLPKYIILLSKSFAFLFKMGISFGIVAIMMLIYNVPFAISLLHFLPILFVLYVVTFGIGSILLHFGVFVEDLNNITTILLKLTFYLSGIFYVIGTRVPQPYGTYLLRGNPAAFLIDSFRNIFLYGTGPSYMWLAIWFLIGSLFIMIGVNLIHKYENSYVKVV